MSKITGVSVPNTAPVTSTTSTNTATATATDATQTRFLKLLTTQMQNQDPLNPMDNAQVTSQLAQINTVSGINQLSQTVSQMAASLSSGQMLQAAGLVGRQAYVAGSNLVLTSSGATGAVNLASAANDVKVTIKDSAGSTVSTQDLGAMAAGQFKLSWDGTNDQGTAMPVGTYQVSVAATTAAGQAVSSTVQTSGLVSSVTMNGGQVQVDVAGLGSVALSDISQIM